MKIYAHRGSSLLWPENTMLAFENAHRAGANAFETDLRLSADDEIILSHDDNLQRFGHPETTVSQLAARQVQRIVVPSPDGIFSDKMITLQDLLVQFPDKDYIFDCKITSELLMLKLHALLTELDFKQSVWFLTWSAMADRLLEAHFSGYAYFPRESISRRWALASILRMGRLLQPNHKILGLPAYYNGLPVFGKAQVQSIRSAGKTFLGYIVNSRKDYERCVECGVDVILTDRPDLIAEFQTV